MSTEQLPASRPTYSSSQLRLHKPPALHGVHPRAPRSRRSFRLIKRLFDLIVAAGLLCLFAAPMLVVALVIKVTSRGPVLFRQERIGLGGRSFVMYKFRTMRLDAEAATGPVWAKRVDPRCTPVGAVLRRLSLDELPQLFNVLRGDMSMVGPRPERPYFVQLFSSQIAGYNQRHQALPGITGWAQVNGWRGDSSVEKRLDHDLYYINHGSLWLDLRILLATPRSVLIERNAC